MKKEFIFLIFINLIYVSSYSQIFFSKIIDFGGDEMEGRAYNVIPLQDEIKIIGILHDSMVAGFDGGTWPVLGTMAYSSEYLNSTILIDSVYSDGFYYFTRRIAFKNDSICYLYDRRDIGSPLLDAYLIEMNFRTGRILNSKIIYDEISNNAGFLATDMALGKNGNIYLINITDASGTHPQILTVLDSNLVIKTQTFIPNFGRNNFTKYTEEDSEGNLILIGVSLGESNGIWFESKLFRQVLDKGFNSIDFKLAPTFYDQTIIGVDYYPVIKAKNGDWVFASQVLKRTNDCINCSILIPYAVCISPDFTLARWETRFFDGNLNESSPTYEVQAITEVSDGYIFAGATDGMLGIEKSGLLGKVSLSGDSLWLKHIIPIEWDTIQASWFQFRDIKTSPVGNIVIAGYGSDRYTHSIRPWILHLDENGCIEPGCNLVSTGELNEDKLNLFSTYPNPASSFIGLNCLREVSEKCTLAIYDYSGVALMKKQIKPQQGYHYQISVPSEIQGQFIITIEKINGEVLYTNKIFIQ